MKMKDYKVDVVVPMHGRLDLTMRCVNALYANTHTQFHLIAVDDSTDLTPIYMRDLEKNNDNITYIHSDEPYKEGNQIFNIGIANSVTPYIATVMNSVTVEPDWHNAALRLMEDEKKCGVIGFKCLFPNGLIESAGITMIKYLPCDVGRDAPGYRLSGIYPMDAVQWAFALLRKEAVEGNIEEGVFHGFKGVDDIDNCMAIKKLGWDIWYCGMGVGIHEPRATRGSNSLDAKNENAENMTTFYKRWGLYDMFLEEMQGTTEEDKIHQFPRTK